jgi:hypothetical protein
MKWTTRDHSGQMGSLCQMWYWLQPGRSDQSAHYVALIWHTFLVFYWIRAFLVYFEAFLSWCCLSAIIWPVNDHIHLLWPNKLCACRWNLHELFLRQGLKRQLMILSRIPRLCGVWLITRRGFGLVTGFIHYGDYNCTWLQLQWTP